MGRVTYNQSGYVGCSMSSRAVEAYDNGEMPKSKWTKKAMLGTIAATLEYEDMLTSENMAMFQSLKKDELFARFFTWSSWHHTGKFANETDFYSVFEPNVFEYIESSQAA